MKINENIDSLKKYETLYNESIQSPEKFWGKKAERLNWYKKWNKTSRFDFVKGEIEWFIGGEINASYNCLDRHINIILRATGLRTDLIYAKSCCLGFLVLIY